MAHKRVLVADSNSLFLEKTGEILEAEGIRALSAENGQSTLSLCRTEQPDAAMINWELASMSGGEVCQRIKAQDPFLPVVLMFPEQRKEVAEFSRRHGADNYLIRPIRRKELLFCVRSLLILRRLFNERKASAALIGEGASADAAAMVSLETYHRFLDLEIRRADRYGFPLTVLSISIDPLPAEIPDAWKTTLEKQLGEALSSAVRACVRDIDLSTSLSMREVLVLMPLTDAQGARTAAERIRATIASQPYHFGRARLQPTVSIGLGIMHGDRIPAAQLLSSAQSRRMQAAHAGGNRILS